MSNETHLVKDSPPLPEFEAIISIAKPTTAAAFNYYTEEKGPDGEIKAPKGEIKCHFEGISWFLAIQLLLFGKFTRVAIVCHISIDNKDNEAQKP